MKKHFQVLLVGVLLALAGNVFSQTPRIYFDTVYAQAPCNVTSKLYFENIPPLSSLDLVSYFKNTALTMYGSQSNFPAGGSAIINQIQNYTPNHNAIMLAWYGLNPVSFPGSNAVLTLNFHYVQDSSVLFFDTTGFSTFPVPLSGSPGYVLPCPTSVISSPALNTVAAGSIASFSVPYLGSTITYQWQGSFSAVGPYLNLVNSANVSGATSHQLNLVVSNSLSPTYYRCVISGTCMIASSTSVLSILGATVTGKFTYDNAASTPLQSCPVSLKQGSIIVANTMTDVNGDYTFNNVPFGSYQVEASVPKPWGGVNTSDVLLIAQFTVGMATLSALRTQAADVNASGFVNSADALMVMKRFVGLINSFPAGNWISTSSVFNASAPATYTVNLKAICTGDVNGSHTP